MADAPSSSAAALATPLDAGLSHELRVGLQAVRQKLCGDEEVRLVVALPPPPLHSTATHGVKTLLAFSTFVFSPALSGVLSAATNDGFDFALASPHSDAELAVIGTRALYLARRADGGSAFEVTAIDPHTAAFISRRVGGDGSGALALHFQQGTGAKAGVRHVLLHRLADPLRIEKLLLECTGL